MPGESATTLGIPGDLVDGAPADSEHHLDSEGCVSSPITDSL